MFPVEVIDTRKFNMAIFVSVGIFASAEGSVLDTFQNIIEISMVHQVCVNSLEEIFYGPVRSDLNLAPLACPRRLHQNNLAR